MIHVEAGCRNYDPSEFKGVQRQRAKLINFVTRHAHLYWRTCDGGFSRPTCGAPLEIYPGQLHPRHDRRVELRCTDPECGNVEPRPLGKVVSTLRAGIVGREQAATQADD